MYINNSLKLELPDNVRYIIKVLEDSGYEAFAVGGCVRDSVIGREPNDWDITTSALPMQIKALFPRTIDTGIVHGTVTVMMGKEGYEVTTYRIDGDYEDSRHPKQVEFTDNLVMDLKRRDFTINAMAYNDRAGIVDEFGGVEDLEKGIIRCVGNPYERFGEDALRILRAVRFSAQLGFEIDELTSEAISKLSPTLEKISKERIHTELNKLLKSKNPDYFNLADSLGIMQVIIPEYHSVTDICKQLLGRLVKLVDNNLPERYAAMLLYAVDDKISSKVCEEMDTEKASDSCRNIMKQLKLDNDNINMAVHIIKWHNFSLEMNEVQLRHLMHDVEEDKVLRVMEFRYQLEQARLMSGLEGSPEKVKAAVERCKAIIRQGDCVSLKNLAITGKDLIAMGLKPGKGMGVILEELLNQVMEQPSLNTQEQLTVIAGKLMIDFS